MSKYKNVGKAGQLKDHDGKVIHKPYRAGDRSARSSKANLTKGAFGGGRA